MKDKIMDKLELIQDQLFKYFKDVDDNTFVEFVSAFVYTSPSNDSNIGVLVKQFIKDQGIETAFNNVLTDENRKLKSKLFVGYASSGSERDIVDKIRLSLLSLSYNRLRNKVQKEILNYKIDLSENEKNFNYMKRHLLSCYDTLNNNDNYFDGKEQDEKLVTKITKIKWQE